MEGKHPCVGEARSIGLFGALELVKNRKSREPMAPYGATSEAMTKMVGFLRENGVFCFANSNILHTNPPLTVTEKELTDVFAIVDRALELTDQYIS